MYTSKKTFAVLVITLILLPTQTFAAWWNPLTWAVFKKPAQEKSAQEKPAPTFKETAAEKAAEQKDTKIDRKDKPSSELDLSTQAKRVDIPATAPKPVTDVKPVATPKPVSKPSLISPQDELIITGTIKGLISSVQTKDVTMVNNLISSESKNYFDRMVNLSKTAQKEEILVHDFMTIVSVVLIRLSATSSTLQLKGTDLISEAVELSTSNWTKSIDTSTLKVRINPLSSTQVEAEVTTDGKTLSKTRLKKENGIWKIDLDSLFTDKNAEVEKKVREKSVEYKVDRSKIMETAIAVLFGNSTESNYLIWVPLNQRGDLNVANVKWNGFAATLSGYSMQYPDKWQIDLVDSTTFFLAPLSADGIRATIAITPNLTPFTTNLDSYMTTYIEDLKKVKTDISGAVTSNQTTFLGQPAYKVSHKRLRTFNEGRTYVTQMNESYIFIRNGIIYLVEYRNGVSDFEKTRALAEKTIGTMKFGPICSKNCSSDMYDNN